MSLRHPLASVKGLGASGEGSHHWWLQRISALALVPLTLWFVFAVTSHVGDPYPVVLDWLSQPSVAVLTVLYLIFMFFHAQLGLQVVIEDYVHGEGLRMCCLLLTKGITVLAAALSVFAVLRVAI